MAMVTLANGFSRLSSWPGDLLNGTGAVEITAHTATTFSFTYPAGHPFAGYSVTIKGSGFAYLGSTPVDGQMASIVFDDSEGKEALAIRGLTANTPASDLNLFHANVFGWDNPDGGHVDAQSKNAWSQILMGDDTVTGTSGGDSRGFPGVNAGNDLFDMGDGSDYVLGGIGNDTIHGGNGFDTLSFEDTHWNEGIPMVRGINANLGSGVVLDAYGFSDVITGVEQIIGSSFADVIAGDGNNNSFQGGRGRDTIDGGGGTDIINYHEDQWRGGQFGIEANLTKGTIRDAFGNTDKVSSIENITGTRFADSFVGSAGGNRFRGAEGKDSYDGKGGQDEILFYGNFSGASQTGIKVDLSKASGQIIDDGFGNTETAVGIEGIDGGSFGDRIKGNTSANFLTGDVGTDTLTGGGGADEFVWWYHSDMNGADIVTDFTARAGAERDILKFQMSYAGGSTELKLVNGTAATTAAATFIFDAANSTLYFDEDGTGAADRMVVAILQGVHSLSAANFELA